MLHDLEISNDFILTVRKVSNGALLNNCAQLIVLGNELRFGGCTLSTWNYLCPCEQHISDPNIMVDVLVTLYRPLLQR